MWHHIENRIRGVGAYIALLLSVCLFTAISSQHLLAETPAEFKPAGNGLAIIEKNGSSGFRVSKFLKLIALVKCKCTPSKRYVSSLVGAKQGLDRGRRGALALGPLGFSPAIKKIAHLSTIPLPLWCLETSRYQCQKSVL